MDAEGKNRLRLKGTVTTALVVAFVLTLTLSLQFFLGTPKGLRLVPSAIAVFALIVVNLILVSIFILLIGRILVKLWLNKRKGLPGASFSIKLVSSVLLATTVPAIFLFFVSAGFVSKSVEVWFSERREAALKSVVDVAKEFTMLLENTSQLFCSSVVSDLKREGLIPLRKDKNSYWKVKWILNNRVRQFGMKFAEIYLSDGTKYATTLKKLKRLHRDIEIEKLVVNVLKDGEPHGFYHKRYYCYLYPYVEGGFVIFAAKKLSKKASAAIYGINKTYQEYSSLKVIKDSIKNTYIAVLLMISALIIFSSSWYALQIAKGVTAPVEALINATKEVARGNLDVQLEVKGRDELGMLVAHFNRMIRELAVNRRKLEESKAFIETVVESIDTGIVSIDRNGRITTINSAARSILGIENNPVGKRYWEVFPKEQLKPLYAIIRKLIRSSKGVRQKGEITLYVKGEPKHLLVGASTLFDSKGRWTGVVIVLEDITELVKAQRAQAWEEVARRLAHEIKNPLTPITLSAQRIKRKIRSGALSERDAESLSASADTIVRCAESISNMVSEFYRFARLPETKLAPEDIREVIREAVSLYRDNKKIDFRLEFSENLPERTLLDREKMISVFVNLIDNAIHAMEGEGTVTIRADYREDENKIVIEVADTGCGVPDEYKDKLFLPYFSKRKGGTGLGLAIVDRIIADHNGYIRVRDNVPKGTVFVIEIPHRERP